MATTSIQQNAVPNDPSLADLLNLLKREIFLDLNCHHLATVQSFNSVNQTVTATINYTKTIFQLDDTSKLYVPIQISYPIMVDMPVIVLGGGKTNLTFPIVQGDQCVILFNDRNIDNWFSSGQPGPVANPRAHSFADGLALIGLNSLNTSIQDYDTLRAVLRNGTTGVGVGASKVKIFNAVNGSLGIALSSLLTALNTFMTAAATSTTDPVLAAAATAFSTAAATAITNIEGLLE
jgi:hypothetical protein